MTIKQLIEELKKFPANKLDTIEGIKTELIAATVFHDRKIYSDKDFNWVIHNLSCLMNNLLGNPIENRIK